MGKVLFRFVDVPRTCTVEPLCRTPSQGICGFSSSPFLVDKIISRSSHSGQITDLISQERLFPAVTGRRLEKGLEHDPTSAPPRKTLTCKYFTCDVLDFAPAIFFYFLRPVVGPSTIVI